MIAGETITAESCSCLGMQTQQQAIMIVEDDPVEERVVSYKKCLSEIREEEEILKELLSDLIKRTGYNVAEDVEGGAISD